MSDYKRGINDFANVLLKCRVIDKSMIKRVKEQLIENNEREIYSGNFRQNINLSLINERREVK